VLSLGRVKVLQGPGGNLADNNDFSLALCMGLPCLLQIGLSETNKHLRRGILLAVPLTALTVIMTHSRGGFLALSAVLFMLVWNSRNRLLGIGLGFVAVIIGILVTPQSYRERLMTMKNYQEDGSAMGRIAAWETAINMGTAYPMFGVGMMMFEKHYRDHEGALSIQYKTGGRVAHNAYLQLFAECGAPALAMYLFLLLFSIYSLRRLRSEARERYHSSWIINYATMFETTLIAFMVGSTFLNRAHFDLFYHFVAISVAFEEIARREMRGLVTVPTRGGKKFGGVLVPARTAGFQRLPKPSGFRDRPALG
jgi:probable O-glycosylation ligase (exosortase A-associated)